MLTLVSDPRQKSRAGWLLSMAVHLALAGTVAISGRLQPKRTLTASKAPKSIALLAPRVSRVERRALPVPQARIALFRLPPAMAAKSSVPASIPAPVSAPVIQSAAAQPAPASMAAIPAPPPPQQTLFSSGSQPAPARELKTTVQNAGFDTQAPPRENSVRARAGGFTPTGFGGAAQNAEARTAGMVTATGGFGDASSAAPVIRPAAVATMTAPADSTPVEILFQPRPGYSAEARQLKIEGQVLVQAVLTATGEVKIVRILRGLGHGLDESALAAVAQIRFRPASFQGRPVDTTATVRMKFELAF